MLKGFFLIVSVALRGRINRDRKLSPYHLPVDPLAAYNKPVVLIQFIMDLSNGPWSSLLKKKKKDNLKS